MPGLKITNFHYTNTVFPPKGEFVEFPKYIYPEGRPPVIVQNAEEEAAVMNNPHSAAPPPPAPEPVVAQPTTILAGANDEREILFQIAKEKNIKVDARWKTERLRATIERETAAL